MSLRVYFYADNDNDDDVDLDVDDDADDDDDDDDDDVGVLSSSRRRRHDFPHIRFGRGAPTGDSQRRNGIGKNSDKKERNLFMQREKRHEKRDTKQRDKDKFI